jgi:hypothetical protein
MNCSSPPPKLRPPRALTNGVVTTLLIDWLFEHRHLLPSHFRFDELGLLRLDEAQLTTVMLKRHARRLRRAKSPRRQR